MENLLISFCDLCVKKDFQKKFLKEIGRHSQLGDRFFYKAVELDAHASMSKILGLKSGELIIMHCCKPKYSSKAYSLAWKFTGDFSDWDNVFFEDIETIVEVPRSSRYRYLFLSDEDVPILGFRARQSPE